MHLLTRREEREAEGERERREWVKKKSSDSFHCFYVTLHTCLGFANGKLQRIEVV